MAAPSPAYNRFMLNTLRSIWLPGFLAVAVCAVTAEASARPSTTSFTCDALQDYVDRRGAVVMNTKSQHVYKRFVRSRAQCTAFEIIEWRWVPSKTGRCGLKICWEPLIDKRWRRP